MPNMFIETAEKLFGADGMKRPPSRNEIYDCLDDIADVYAEAIKDLRAKIDAIGTEKAVKPRVRVPAGRSDA